MIFKFLPVEHRSCNRGGYPTPPTPRPPLKNILKFFAKLVLPRKQSFNFTVVFPLKRKTFLKNVQRSFKFFRKRSRSSKCAFFSRQNFYRVCFPPKFLSSNFYLIFSRRSFVCKAWHQRDSTHSTYPPQ